MILDSKAHHWAAHHIEIFVDRIEQLFNSMDPSPFHEKDLDHDAEEFIVSWAQEYHLREPLILRIHVNEYPAEADSPRDACSPTTGVPSYVTSSARLTNSLGDSRMAETGPWRRLVIGSSFTFDIRD